MNTELLPDPKTWPKRVEDLLDPRWKEQGFVCAMARPLTGTTYTHAVAWLTRAPEEAIAFFEGSVQAAEAGRLKLVTSNGQVMSAVSDSSQRVAFGLTDTDDAWIAISEKQAPVAIVYPNQDDGDVGALLIPNTAGLVRGAPHPDAAATFLRWLASPDTEARLATSRSAQIPVRPEVPVPPDGHVKLPGKDFRAQDVDWYAVGGAAGSLA